MMEVSIDYLFSNQKKFFSRAISTGTRYALSSFRYAEKVPSHTAFVIEGRWVVESVFKGGYRVIPYDKWKLINREIARIPAGKKSMDEVKEKSRKFVGKKYDVYGAVYLALCFALKIFFGVPLPVRNRLDDSDKFFCCELVAAIDGENFTMKSPGDVMVHVIQKYGINISEFIKIRRT